MKVRSDIDLIAACLKNERQAQKELYKKYYSYGMSVTIRYAKNKEDAQWLLNQAFMKVFTHLNQFKTGAEFRPWFRRIVINTVLSANKKFHLEDSNLEGIDQSDEDDVDIISELTYDEILKEIQSLTPAYRTVLNLYLIDGYKHHEIAEKMGISEGTSKSNLFKAKEMLKKRLKENLGIERV